MILLALVACTAPTPPPRWHAGARLAIPADPWLRDLRSEIAFDSRPILFHPAHFDLPTRPTDLLDDEGALQLVGPVPASRLGEDRVVLWVRVRRDGHWQPLPPQLLAWQPTDERPYPGISTLLRDVGAPGEELRIAARIYEPIREPYGVDSGPVTLAPATELRFAIGILEAGRQLADARFGVAVCEEGSCQPVFEERIAAADAASWQNRRVDLSSWAGRTVQLRFETAPVVEAEGVDIALPALANPTLFEARRPQSGGAHNLILLSIESLRADHLGSYGYPRDTSPTLDRELAERGTVFARCFANSSSTSPSHLTLFTSLLPSVHRGLADAHGRPLDRWMRTLAEELRDAGFVTGAVVEDGDMEVSRGFAQGFDRFLTDSSRGGPTRAGALEATLDEARHWITAQRDARFFLFLHTYQTHEPHQGPAAYRHLFQQPIPGRSPLLEVRRHHRPARYDREIRSADDLLGPFLAWLAEEGLLEETIFVLTSGHGEAFLEHGTLGHGSGLYDEELHVPLLFRGPGIPAGLRVEENVSLLDLKPTLLELMGAAPSAQATGESFAGAFRSAAPAADRLIFGEAWAREAQRPQERVAVDQPTLAVRRGQFKLLRFRSGEDYRYELYDLADDPAERRNLFASETAVAEQLRPLLDGYEARAKQQRAAVRSRAWEQSRALRSARDEGAQPSDESERGEAEAAP